MTGKTQIIESGTEVTITLDADNARMRIGGHGGKGTLRLADEIGLLVFDADGRWLSLGTSREYLGARPEGHSGGLRVFHENGKLKAQIDASSSSLKLGKGDLQNSQEIELLGGQCLVRIGEPRATDEQGRPTLNGGDRAIELEGRTAKVSVGRDDISGSIEIKNHKNRTAILLDAFHAQLTLGATDSDGDLLVLDGQKREVARIDGGKAELSLGATGAASSLRFYDAAGREGLRYDGAEATLRVGISGNGGKFMLRDGAGRAVLQADADASRMTLGASGRAGAMAVCDANGKETIQLDGASGDILLTNADCAEEFDFEVAAVAAGTVVVIGEHERLRPSTQAYDRRVAGVVSGAGKFKPAIVLDRRAGGARPAVAMIGKVECLVDATQGPIRCGDLLVSSPTPGHAMAGSDPARTPGAVLGKALRALESGTGMIPILVCLQ